MNRLLAFLIALLLGCAMFIGYTLAGWFTPNAEIIAAQAQQERAKAAQMEQAALQAALDTQARTAALDATVTSIRMAALGGALAFTLVAVGAAGAAALWLITRARVAASVLYPNRDGHYPLIMQNLGGGAVRVLDTSRALGPLITAFADGDASMPLSGSEETHAGLATSALQAAVMLGVSRNAKTDFEVPARAAKALNDMPKPIFASGGTSESTRLVYVNDKRRNVLSEREKEMRELREFIETGARLGYGREAWMQYRFASTGRTCSKSYWRNRLVGACLSANVLSEKPSGGYELACTVEEALAAFGFPVGSVAVAGGQEDETETN